MVSNLPKLTFRLEEELLKKLDHIAAKNRRYRNQEVCYVLTRYIEQYEAKNGTIVVDDKQGEG